VLIVTPRPSPPALANQQCKNNKMVQRLVPVITLIATASNDSYDTARSAPAAAGLAWPCFFFWPFCQIVKPHFLDQIIQVPTVMKNGLRQSSTKKSMVPQVVRNGPNTHVIIDNNPPMNRSVGQSQSILTVGLITPPGEHG